MEGDFKMINKFFVYFNLIYKKLLSFMTFAFLKDNK
jgi:hypothetical protein